jgi:hypothetical protein
MTTTPIAITIGNAQLAATLEKNATSDALISRLPISLAMLDLYDHELVHRFTEPLPVSGLTACTPRRGDIVYWAPRNALALFYGDGDEQFADIQVVGRVDSGMDAVDHPGNVTATFSLPANT